MTRVIYLSIYLLSGTPNVLHHKIAAAVIEKIGFPKSFFRTRSFSEFAMGVRGPEGRGETPRTKQTGASDAGARIRNLIPWNGNRSVATSRPVGSGQARWHGSGAGEKFLTGRGVEKRPKCRGGLCRNSEKVMVSVDTV